MDIFKSRTVLTILVDTAFTIAYLVQPMVDPDVFLLITGVLKLLAIYFRITPRKQF